MKLSWIMGLMVMLALLTTQAGMAQVQETGDLPSGSDSIVPQFIDNPVKDLQEVTLSGGRDTLNRALKDHPEAAKFDSLWLEELRLFSKGSSEMYQEIQDVAADSLNIKTDSISTELLKERLRLLDEKTPFNISYNPSLERVIKHFLTHRRDLMQRMLSSSAYYFPLFEETLDKYSLPLELKYLSIVESALNPTAKSRVGATGLWQFMFSTGKIYGLDVSSYVDERSDPVLATDAASRYLAKLHDIFDDWDLALAAYNSGPGNVNKAIRRSGGYENYWSIRGFLPRETAGYVPAFLATMYIFEYAEEHGLKPSESIRHAFETDTVIVKETITFEQVAEITGVPEEELKILNPSYKLGIIPRITGKEYTLRLPSAAIGPFVANEVALYEKVKKDLEAREKALPKYVESDDRIRYRVRSGDYLGKIAERYGVGVSQIKRWNGLKSNNLRIGQRLTIYPRKPVTTQPATPSKNTAAASQNPDAKVHVVEKGDSLWTISKKYQGITVENLREWNGIRGSDLKPGTRLKLCSCTP